MKLERDALFVLQTAEILGNHERVSLDFPRLPEVVKPGDSIFMNDGYIELKVIEVKAGEVHCTVKVGANSVLTRGSISPGSIWALARLQSGIGSFWHLPPNRNWMRWVNPLSWDLRI
ncbi:MAG: pyruvate kinase [Chloroflexi bacterium]|nr:pyruvate kinase [Chloroflexota bacterium]